MRMDGDFGPMKEKATPKTEHEELGNEQLNEFKATARTERSITDLYCLDNK